MQITARDAGKMKIVEIEGDITHQNVRDFSIYLDGMVEAGSIALVLDLGGVPYVTSRGLGAIVTTYTSVRKRGGNVVVMRPQPEVLKTLELTRLDRILDIVQSEEEAARLLVR